MDGSTSHVVHVDLSVDWYLPDISTHSACWIEGMLRAIFDLLFLVFANPELPLLTALDTPTYLIA